MAPCLFERCTSNEIKCRTPNSFQSEFERWRCSLYYIAVKSVRAAVRFMHMTMKCLYIGFGPMLLCAYKIIMVMSTFFFPVYLSHFYFSVQPVLCNRTKCHYVVLLGKLISNLSIMAACVRARTSPLHSFQFLESLCNARFNVYWKRSIIFDFSNIIFIVRICVCVCFFYGNIFYTICSMRDFFAVSRFLVV